MNLEPPEKVWKLQSVLCEKAKKSPDYRFYALYDKIHREDVLAWAYERCLHNDGAAGVDGQDFKQIEEYGRDRWLSELAKELQEGTYRPEAVRRVWIPKADGKKRPLGIPTIRDRVAQTAAMIVLEPIFDEDLQPEQHAYRVNHSAHKALREVQAWLDKGCIEVVDADLSGYFDSIPHHELMKCVARRISDSRVLELIKMWLEAPVEETHDGGRVSRTTRNKDEGRGTPQGGVLSPLLANLYMRRFVLGWKSGGHEHRLQAHIVNYADDFVICCQRGRGELAMTQMRRMMEKLRLTVNEQKTRLCRLQKDESFDFLGFTFGWQTSWRKGRRYIAPQPARKRVLTICEKISEETGSRMGWRDEEEMVGQLNAVMRGWCNYFNLGNVMWAWSIVQQHGCRRLRRWLRRKHGQRGSVLGYPDMKLYETYGLVNLVKQVRRESLWA